MRGTIDGRAENIACSQMDKELKAIQSQCVDLEEQRVGVMRLVYNNQCGCGERVWLEKFQLLRHRATCDHTNIHAQP